jgi:hypothetical protein
MAATTTIAAPMPTACDFMRFLYLKTPLSDGVIYNRGGRRQGRGSGGQHGNARIRTS